MSSWITYYYCTTGASVRLLKRIRDSRESIKRMVFHLLGNFRPPCSPSLNIDRRAASRFSHRPFQHVASRYGEFRQCIKQIFWIISRKKYLYHLLVSKSQILSGRLIYHYWSLNFPMPLAPRCMTKVSFSMAAWQSMLPVSIHSSLFKDDLAFGPSFAR